MSDQPKQTNEHPTDSGNTKPDLVAKTREGYGKKASFNTVGVAWSRDDGSIYIRPYGTQIIDGPVYLFKVAADQ